MSWRRVETVVTPWQRVEVWKTDRAAELRAGGAVHAWWHRDRLLTGMAWDAIAAACLLRTAGPPARVLMLGLAGGTALRVLRHLLPTVQLTAVELDRGILELARRYLELDALGVEVIEGEAGAWLRANRRTFDAIIDDCYLAETDDVERRGWSEGRIEDLRRALRPGGVVVVNLVNSPGHEPMIAEVTTAMREGFPAVGRVLPPASWNEVLVAGEAVGTAETLERWIEAFPHRFDRRYWRRLRVE